MRIKVLFIPHPMPSHLVPLVALAKQLNKNDFDCSFLLPEKFHGAAKSLGFQVLPIDRKLRDRITPEIMAFSKYRPDVVVDDLSYITAFSTRFVKIPRISIARRGVIPFEKHNPNYIHSSNIHLFMDEVNKLELDKLGLWKPEKTTDLFVGDVNIIPSIPSVEPLPEELKNNDSYKYAGPLILEDEEIMSGLALPGDPIKQMKEFLAKNSSRKKVYFTRGLTNPEEIKNRALYSIKTLLSKNVAIITNLNDDLQLTEDEKSRVFANPLLPMHTVCSSVDLMIHHCGSGAYGYQLLHQVPAIILGSKCYDRDEVALQLDNLNAANYIPAEVSEDDFRNEFDTYLSQLLNENSSQYNQQKTALLKLNNELVETRNNFKFGEVVRQLLQTKKF